MTINHSEIAESRLSDGIRADPLLGALLSTESNAKEFETNQFSFWWGFEEVWDSVDLEVSVFDEAFLEEDFRLVRSL